MGGALDETTFNDLEFEAESIINWYTFNRLAQDTEYSDNVKRLMYRLIQICEVKRLSLSVGTDPTAENSVSGAISSQSNDGFSTSFNVLSASDAIKVSDSETAMLIKRYLSVEVNSLGQKLLYRGIYPNE